MNELSLTKVAGKESAKQMMLQFLSTCVALNNYGFGSLRIPDSQVILDYELCDGYRIIDWRNDNEVNKDYKNRFRSLATKSPIIPNENEKLLHQQKLSEFRFINDQNNEPCLGLGLAHLTDTISISFCSSNTWNNHEIELNYLLLNDDETFINQLVSVRHASKVLHLDNFTEWINSLLAKGLIKDWYPHLNHFPRIELSDQLVPSGDWAGFYSDMQQLSPQLRITRFIETGEKVAQRNGYIKDGKASRINNRIVYAAGYSQGRIYLALDTLHGSFEVCNYKGSSIGEYGFHGNRIGNGHNIQL